MTNFLKALFIIISISVYLFADEFEVTSFKNDISDLSARTYPKTDVNDDYCAIIKIRTDLKQVQFYSNLLVDSEIKTGEYWIYVSPNIRHLELMKDGFTKLSYQIPELIKSNNVYIMELTNKNQTRLTVVSKPLETKGSTIFINGEKQDEVTPATFILEPGTYSIAVRHSDFLEVTQDITVEENERKDAIFNLMPSQIKVISAPVETEGANIFINGTIQNKITPATFKLQPGKYSITLKHKDFLDMTKDATVVENQRLDLIFNMTPYQGSALQKQSFWMKNKWISLGVGAAAIGVGVLCNMRGDNYYDQYNSAITPDAASDARNSTDQFYQLRDISYSVSVVPVVYGVFSWFKQSRYSK